MANAIENIITKVSRKNEEGGFDTPVPIGSAAKYISAVRGTSVNNMEENFFLGSNMIVTEEELPNEVMHIIEEYREEDVETNFYFLEIYKYKNISFYKRWFQGDTLHLPNDDTMYDSEEELLIGLDTNVYSFDGDTFVATNEDGPFTPAVVIATLKFVNSEGEIVPVAEKTVYAKITEDGKITQKTVIENLLE